MVVLVVLSFVMVQLTMVELQEFLHRHLAMNSLFLELYGCTVGI